jgi:hypothetical protein
MCSSRSFVDLREVLVARLELRPRESQVDLVGAAKADDHAID